MGPVPSTRPQTVLLTDPGRGLRTTGREELTTEAQRHREVKPEKTTEKNEEREEEN
jgi:hypothetical protein